MCLVTVSDCRAWWDGGGRRWHNSVDVPGDVDRVEREIAMESVVGLDKALAEIEGSDVSDFSKAITRKVFEVVIDKWLKRLN